jgi:hypothetical protein
MLVLVRVELLGMMTDRSYRLSQFTIGFARLFGNGIVQFSREMPR